MPHAPPGAEAQCTAGATLATPRVAGPARPGVAPSIAPSPPLDRQSIGLHCSDDCIAPTQVSLQQSRRAVQVPERRRGPPADPSTHPHSPASARAVSSGAAAAHREDGHFSADVSSRHAGEGLSAIGGGPPQHSRSRRAETAPQFSSFPPGFLETPLEPPHPFLKRLLETGARNWKTG